MQVLENQLMLEGESAFLYYTLFIQLPALVFCLGALAGEYYYQIAVGRERTKYLTNIRKRKLQIKNILFPIPLNLAILTITLSIIKIVALLFVFVPLLFQFSHLRYGYEFFNTVEILQCSDQFFYRHIGDEYKDKLKGAMRNNEYIVILICVYSVIYFFSLIFKYVFDWRYLSMQVKLCKEIADKNKKHIGYTQQIDMDNQNAKAKKKF